MLCEFGHKFFKSPQKLPGKGAGEVVVGGTGVGVQESAKRVLHRLEKRGSGNT